MKIMHIAGGGAVEKVPDARRVDDGVLTVRRGNTTTQTVLYTQTITSRPRGAPSPPPPNAPL